MGCDTLISNSSCWGKEVFLLSLFVFYSVAVPWELFIDFTLNQCSRLPNSVVLLLERHRELQSYEEAMVSNSAEGIQLYMEV